MTPRSYPLENLFGRVLTPLEHFLQRSTAGGIVLVGVTLLALTLATALGGAALQGFWAQELALSLGDGFALRMSLQHWVNDGLMTLFFLLVGLELKREILVGELASLRDAALPVLAALGGMLVPAAIYALFNASLPTAAGWGIPMATDIAFAVGILVLLGPRIPRNLIVFLMALAIADDLGAVLVIAAFYTGALNGAALLASALLFGLLLLLNRGGVRRPLPYALLGLLLWGAVLASGVHATIAGILLALAIPSRARHSPAQFEARVAELQANFSATADGTADPLGNPHLTDLATALERAAEAAQSPLLRIEHSLSPWVTFVIVPVFALANAGIDLGSIRAGELLQPVTLGVVLGLVLGKFAGISLFSVAAVRLGLARLPAGVGWGHLTGAAWLGGIGFTMSLFISQLAFREAAWSEQARLGILLASALATVVGLGWLLVVTRRRRA